MHRFLLLSLLLLTGCDFGDPSEVAGRTEAALREYFPRASAVVQPQNSTIYGMTCVDLGRKLVGQIAPVLASSPEVKRLRSLRKLEWLPGNHTYRYFVVGFEKQLVVYDVDKDDVQVRDAEADYQAIYRQRCTVPQTQAASYP
ncbi:MAG TPA: hypothetical protein VHN74_15630 [Candidatus Angelobacter sp.]|jgi:hypothetical protein|nr:hypothetical protein [Candidatus Angelobacter sp.]